MNKEEIKQKDKENKAIKFYKNFIEAQEKEMDWMYKQDEEYYKYNIEEKELLIKGFRTILNLIQKQENEINKLKETLNDRVDIKQTADSISFTLPSKVAAESMKVLNESALAIENKRLCELLEKQEKIIDKMAERIANIDDDLCDYIDQSYNNNKCRAEGDCVECIKEYYEKEVEKDV